MALTIPPAVNYQTPLVSLPAFWDRAPVEGSRLVPVEIDWGDYEPELCVDLNLFGGAAQTISQIVALSVDNSACGANVVFIFPDTQQTYQVKAQTPVAVFPVFTGGTELFVSAPGAKAGDVTRLAILNAMPPPVALSEAVPPTETASVAQIAVPSTPVTVIVPAGVDGTLTGISVNFQGIPTNTVVPFTVTDGTGKLLFAGSGWSSGDPVLALSGLSLGFTDGLNFNLPSGGPAAATASVNVLFTVP